MDRTSGFGRLALLGAMTMAASGAGVATALAQELHGCRRADPFRAPAPEDSFRPAQTRGARVVAPAEPLHGADASRRPADHVA